MITNVFETYEMEAWALGGPSFFGYTARWDGINGRDLPPMAGPARDDELLRRGRYALALARRHFGIAVRIVEAWTTRAPLPPWHPLSLRYPRAVAETLVVDDRRRSDNAYAHLDAAAGKATALGADISELDVAQHHARSAVDLATGAFNFLEDTAWAPPLHELAHQVAAFTGGIFGCWLRFDGHIYWRTCPLAMMHLRFGMSAEFTSTRRCSICAADVGDCSAHLPGQAYPVTAALLDGHRCSVCWRNGCSEHHFGKSYTVPAFEAATETTLTASAAVDRPRDPLARWTEIEFPMLFLENRLGYRPAGEPQRCYYCMEPCKGMFTLNQYLAGRNATAFVPSPHHPQGSLLPLKIGH